MTYQPIDILTYDLLAFPTLLSDKPISKINFALFKSIPSITWRNK